MALDDPIPGSSWNGGHYYGEKIPTVQGRRTSGRRFNPFTDQGMRGQPSGVRQYQIQKLQSGQTDLNGKARRQAIARWQNRQDT